MGEKEGERKIIREKREGKDRDSDTKRIIKREERKREKDSQKVRNRGKRQRDI